MSGAELTLHGGLDGHDVQRIEELAEFARGGRTHGVLAALLDPSTPAAVVAELARRLQLTHAALLAFPDTLESGVTALRKLGLELGAPHPSAVVAERLSQRYGSLRGSLELWIVQASLAEDARFGLEVFLLPTDADHATLEVIADERRQAHETHFAFEAVEADEAVLTALRETLLVDCGMAPDGGGYNPHADRTVLYFRGHGSLAAHGWPRRLELTAAGEYRQLLATHLGTAADVEGSTRKLLGLMTGAWATQALRTAAALRVADHIGDAVRTSAELAALTQTHPDSLHRLLRYLASLGVVQAAGDRFSLTADGQLLRTDHPRSAHALALMYGGPFYHSFAALEHGVRTGENAFEHVFADPPFEYLAAHPEDARIFDAAMAAGSTFFAAVPDAYDFRDGDVVVDVGGGIGQLLGQILTARPSLRGVLFDQAHVMTGADQHLGALGCSSRCELVAGDFTAGVPTGGDVYVLSRILHDWPDEVCSTLLRNCRSSMRDGAALLVIERPIPEDDSPSLARAWDLHMMVNNVCGRERTVGEYTRLFTEAGFVLEGRRALGLDVELLVARALRAEG